VPSPGPELRALGPADAPRFAGFTFPAFRHLLSLEPFRNALQDPTQPESEVPRRPFAVGAEQDGAPVGLLLGSIPLEPSERNDRVRNAELLSLFVSPTYRRAGVATALLRRAESVLREQGQRFVHGIYMTGQPSIAHLETMFAREGWSEPKFRFASARFTVERLRQAAWIRRLPNIKGYETVPWHELGDDEVAAARERHERAAWIPDSLRFWLFTPEMADRATSLGIRYKGELVGWVLNHAYQDSKTLRFSAAFVRWDLARLGLALPAVARSIERMPAAGYSHGSFVTPPHLEGMQAAIAKYVAPWADFVGESRGVYKELS
jgi:ribosomal protein S18 acetylase RimI-like enzyme